MTCIIGLVDCGRVYIGSDSAGVAGWDLNIRTDSKVFHNGGMLFGFTSSFRMGQLLRYALVVPEQPPEMETMKYMTTLFVDAVRECLKKGGYAKKENEEESAGTFLVGYKGELFKVCSDYQVEQSAFPFMATGCGEQIALGALHATEDILAAYRIEMALRAAEQFNAAVRGPFVIEEV